MESIELYYSVGDFWNSFQKEWDKHLIDSGK